MYEAEGAAKAPGPLTVSPNPFLLGRLIELEYCFCCKNKGSRNLGPGIFPVCLMDFRLPPPNKALLPSYCYALAEKLDCIALALVLA